jgi:predicted ATPase with chaperone activity
MRSTTGSFVLALAAAGLLLVPVAHAQNESPAKPPMTTPGPKSAPENISDQKLDAAAAAIKRVSDIKVTYDAKVAMVPEAEKARLAGEAEQAMTKAVIDQGLSVDEYLSILRVARADPAVHDQLTKRLK